MEIWIVASAFLELLDENYLILGKIPGIPVIT